MISEESNPRQSQQDLVTSNTQRKLAKQGENEQKVEPDSGYLGSGNTMTANEDDIGDEEVSIDQSIPVPTSPGESNTDSQEEHPRFTIDSEQETKNEVPTKKRAVFISSFNTAHEKLLEIHDEEQEKLSKRIKELEKQLQQEIDAKEALQREKDEIDHQFSKFKTIATEKEKNSERVIKEKEEELEKLKKKFSEIEKEKKENELKYEEEIKQRKEEVKNLRKKLEEEKQAAEYELMKLERDLFKAEKELAKKENVILEQKCEKLQLEKKIDLCSKDAEIRKLKVEKNKLMRGESLHQSLSSLNIDDH